MTRLRRIAPELVPPALRSLIPFAERFGETADTARHRIAAEANPRDLDEMHDALVGKRAELEDWFYSFEYGTEPDCVTYFQGLVLMDLEERQGAGVRGEIDWALDRFQQSPTSARLDRLRRAYQRLGAHLDLLGPLGRKLKRDVVAVLQTTPRA